MKMKNPHEYIITWWDSENKIPIIKTRWQNACEISINNLRRNIIYERNPNNISERQSSSYSL